MDGLLNSTLPFTTTPDARGGSGPPYTDAALQLNFCLRVLLGTAAILSCWVPTKLLWKNGELAAAVWCGDIMLLNFIYVINALIWPDDNVNAWWAGHGWCDAQVYLFYALDSVYANCVFEIMRSLADRVRPARADSALLTHAERRRRRVLSIANIFAVPVVQVALNYLVMTQRYNVSTLIGCTPSFDYSWPYLVFYVLPTPIYTVGAAIFAVLTWKRFSAHDKLTRNARDSCTSSLAARQQRVRRKLYLMAASVLVPFLPVQMLFLAQNIMSGMPWTLPYDFRAVHSSAGAITFTDSSLTGFVATNQNYVAVLSAVPVFVMFGTTAEAVRTYRRYLVALGFAALFPRLRDGDDDHDSALLPTGRKKGRRGCGGTTISATSSYSGSQGFTDVRSSGSITKPKPVYYSPESSTSTSSRDSDLLQDYDHHSFCAATPTDAGVPTSAAPAAKDTNPWPDLSPEYEDMCRRSQKEDRPRRPFFTRSPWVLRTVPAASLSLGYSSTTMQQGLSKSEDETRIGKQSDTQVKEKVEKQYFDCEAQSHHIPHSSSVSYIDDDPEIVTFLDSSTIYTCLWPDDANADSILAVYSSDAS